LDEKPVGRKTFGRFWGRRSGRTTDRRATGVARYGDSKSDGWAWSVAPILFDSCGLVRPRGPVLLADWGYIEPSPIWYSQRACSSRSPGCLLQPAGGRISMWRAKAQSMAVLELAKRTAWRARCQMFEILHRDSNLKPIFTQSERL